VVIASGVQSSSNTAVAAGPQVARLSGGGAALAWIDANTLVAQVIDAAGNNVGSAISVASLFSGSQGPIAVAGLSDGSFVVAWGDETEPQLNNTQFATPYSIQFARYSASGELLEGATRTDKGALFGFVDSHLQLVPMANGGFILAWSASPSGVSALRATFRQFAADGTPVGSAVDLSRQGGDTQLNVVPLADGTLLATWVAQDLAATPISYQVRAWHLDANGRPLTTDPVAVAASTQGSPLRLSATALPGGDAGVAWATASGVVGWQVLDSTGTAKGAAGSRTEAANLISGIVAAPSATGWTVFYGTYMGFSRGTNAAIVALNLDASGTLVGESSFASRSLASVSPTTGATTGPSAADFGIGAERDGHFVAAYESAVSGGAQVTAVGQ
jgi:hypothetical protein